MTIERVKEILGDLVINLSDNEIEDIINSGKRYVNIVLDITESRLKTN